MNLDELLQSLRNQIDTIDEEMIYLFSRRFELVKQIWEIKKKMWADALQPKRWEKLLENLHKEADDKWVNKEFITEIWELIHKEALRLEK